MFIIKLSRIIIRLKWFYQGLSLVKKVFLRNWIYWFLMWIVASRIFLDEQRSFYYHIFHASFMAFFISLPYFFAPFRAFRQKMKQIFTTNSRKYNQ